MQPLRARFPKPQCVMLTVCSMPPLLAVCRVHALPPRLECATGLKAQSIGAGPQPAARRLLGHATRAPRPERHILWFRVTQRPAAPLRRRLASAVRDGHIRAEKEGNCLKKAAAAAFRRRRGMAARPHPNVGAPAPPRASSCSAHGHFTSPSTRQTVGENLGYVGRDICTG
eukprot:262621-Chlamydomonas_euryale.AAC.9